MNPLPKGPFEIVYADPCWPFANTANSEKQWGGAAKHYKTMTVEEICALPVPDIAAKNSLLAMWWVAAMPREALQVIDAWGFQLVTSTGFVWHKLTKNGLDNFGMGTLTRGGAAEMCLFAVKGKPKRISRSVRQMIHAPVREHSRKPDEARERLLQLMGHVPRVELFARQFHYGWKNWGNEI